MPIPPNPPLPGAPGPNCNEPVSQPRAFRILSIDGGGMKGAFPAGLLACAERHLGHPMTDYFDLITGTSTGGIIALGLALGIPASKISRFYSEMGPRIFPAERSRWHRIIGWVCRRPKYHAIELDRALRSVFGQRTLADAIRPVLIPALQARTGKLHVFKSRHHPEFFKDASMEAVAVARATSAAPLYLPAYTAPDNVTYLDGGLAANNPMLLGITEAIRVFGVHPTSIHVLSLACPQELLDLPASCRSDGGGVLQWGRRQLAGVLYAGQDAVMTGVSNYLVPKTQIRRISMVAPKGAYALDHAASAVELAGLGEQAATEVLTELRTTFFSSLVPPTPWPLAPASAI